MRREIFIGDLQGCCEPLERLLEKLAFDPATDRLRFAGDLVNRGGESLETLRRVHSLGDSAITVLGNHDLHLLAYAHGHSPGNKRNAEFEAILDAGDGGELIDWLRQCPLMWLNREQRLALVHAGVDPRWGPEAALAQARDLESTLADDAEAFFERMYGDLPRRWDPDLPHYERLRAITNVLTRMRFCDPEGNLDLETKGGLDNVPEGYRPWFEHLHPEWRGWKLIFGHWSLLGLHETDQVICLDTGCVWGKRLTALVVEQDNRYLVAVDCPEPGSRGPTS